ncbi:MAG TPA: hypothetical protein VL832_19965 [Puia sp.]|nr:hypothetical protein [Puia sp.]
MHRLPFLFLILLVSLQCKKHGEDPPPLNDARTVLLKTATLQNLPSPYYYYEYDDRHYVTRVGFAAGTRLYNMEYTGGRVTKMTETKSGRVCRYVYTGKNVTEINESDASGNQRFSYRFSYNAQELLSQIIWVEFPDGRTGDIIKKAQLSYFPDGNLSALQRYSLTASGGLEPSTLFQFSDYDTGLNVDDFYLVEDFFDTFLFLPRVKLQKNNPRHGKIIGSVSEFDLTYSYQYNDKKWPLSVTETTLQTKGPNPGDTQVYTNQFSYY